MNEQMYTIPKLPPGFEVEQAVSGSFAVRPARSQKLCLFVRQLAPGEFLMSIGDPNTKTWGYECTFSTMQDALDAGVARMWMGVWE